MSLGLIAISGGIVGLCVFKAINGIMNNSLERRIDKQFAKNFRKSQLQCSEHRAKFGLKGSLEDIDYDLCITLPCSDGCWFLKGGLGK